MNSLIKRSCSAATVSISSWAPGNCSSRAKMARSSIGWGRKRVRDVWIVVKEIHATVLGGEHQLQTSRMNSNIVALCQFADRLKNVQYSTINVKHSDVEGVVIICDNHLV